jgi:hypothetical protein
MSEYSTPEAASYDLTGPESLFVYRNRRVGRYMAAVGAVVFLLLTAYAGLTTAFLLMASRPPSVALVVALVASGLVTIVSASAAIMAMGRPATGLLLSECALELRYPAWPRRVRVAWADSRLVVVIRDYRGHPSPVSNVVQIERIGRAPFWLQPPSSPLSRLAVDALVASAERHGLDVRSKPGSTLFNLWPNVEISIRRSTTPLKS